MTARFDFFFCFFVLHYLVLFLRAIAWLAFPWPYGILGELFAILILSYKIETRIITEHKIIDREKKHRSDFIRYRSEFYLCRLSFFIPLLNIIFLTIQTLDNLSQQ